MPTDYTVDDPLDHATLATLVATSLKIPLPYFVKRIGLGSTNLIYQVGTANGPVILKISHRADRIKAGILNKELEMIKRFRHEDLPIAIPSVLWQGKTTENYPAAILSHLDGEPIGTLIKQKPKLTAAFERLGQFNAALNLVTYNTIDEFEAGRPNFNNFADCVNYWLADWQPLLMVADSNHISQQALTTAQQAIRKRLSAFDDSYFSFVHSDLSGENVLGQIINGQLVLSGVCDFETVQTGPPEYDLGSAWNNYFIYYPELEAPFMAGYESVITPHPKQRDRLIACSLFRALRYIKRSVKYHETHYYDHDRQFLEAWLERAD